MSLHVHEFSDHSPRSARSLRADLTPASLSASSLTTAVLSSRLLTLPPRLAQPEPVTVSGVCGCYSFCWSHSALCASRDAVPHQGALSGHLFRRPVKSLPTQSACVFPWQHCSLCEHSLLSACSLISVCPPAPGWKRRGNRDRMRPVHSSSSVTSGPFAKNRLSLPAESFRILTSF